MSGGVEGGDTVGVIRRPLECHPSHYPSPSIETYISINPPGPVLFATNLAVLYKFSVSVDGVISPSGGTVGDLRLGTGYLSVTTSLTCLVTSKGIDWAIDPLLNRVCVARNWNTVGITVCYRILIRYSIP